jgi:hypothetical protein
MAELLRRARLQLLAVWIDLRLKRTLLRAQCKAKGCQNERKERRRTIRLIMTKHAISRRTRVPLWMTLLGGKCRFRSRCCASRACAARGRRYWCQRMPRPGEYVPRRGSHAPRSRGRGPPPAAQAWLRTWSWPHGSGLPSAQALARTTYSRPPPGPQLRRRCRRCCCYCFRAHLGLRLRPELRRRATLLRPRRQRCACAQHQGSARRPRLLTVTPTMSYSRCERLRRRLGDEQNRADRACEASSRKRQPQSKGWH